MHAFLIVGKTEQQRTKQAEELLSQEGAEEIQLLVPIGKTHTINSIRELTRTLGLRAPVKRGVLVEEAEKLTTEAANAFLKTLEEPPQDTIIVLTAPNKGSVLETIASRCLVKDLGLGEVELNAKQKEKAQETFEKLRHGGVGERFKFVDTVKDRENAILFVVGQIYAAREAMTKENKPKEHATLIDALVQTHKDLEANVNTKLTLTELMLAYTPEE